MIRPSEGGVDKQEPSMSDSVVWIDIPVAEGLIRDARRAAATTFSLNHKLAVDAVPAGAAGLILI